MSHSINIKRKRLIQILKFCATGSAGEECSKGTDSSYRRLVGAKSNSLKITLIELDLLSRNALLANEERRWLLTNTGKSHLRRLLCEVDEFQGQHFELGKISVLENGQNVVHSINESETPLSRLQYRKSRNGQPNIDKDCYRAGERLRADFTRGQLVQQLTSNWSEGSIGGGNSNDGIRDMTDAALSARLRFQQALDAIGPEFVGVMLDVCCFLKGLELVERERNWPPRSAKLMLKTGLSILSRYYGMEAKGRQVSPTRHWGNDHYRPTEYYPQGNSVPGE